MRTIPLMGLGMGSAHGPSTHASPTAQTISRDSSNLNNNSRSHDGTTRTVTTTPSLRAASPRPSAMRDPSRPLRIIARQPVGVLSLDIGVQTIDALFGGLSLSHPPSQGSLQASQAFQAPPNPPPTTTSQASTPADHVVPLGFGGRQPIPIPPALAALPLFDTFFDLVEADIGGGIETPTPAPLLASVHELVQSITCSEFTQPETWALAHEWRETVRAAQAPHYGASPSSTPEKEVDVMYAVDLSLDTPQSRSQVKTKSALLTGAYELDDKSVSSDGTLIDEKTGGVTVGVRVVTLMDFCS